MVTVKFETSEEQAQALAQFLKRMGLADYRDHAIDEKEAYQMMHAGEKLRSALATAGFAPR